MQGSSGCPGSAMMNFKAAGQDADSGPAGAIASQLRQWPIQLHLISPVAPYYQGADVVLAADCVAYAVGDFHREHLKGKSLAIACPKLDSEQQVYLQKIKAWLEEATINTLTVMMMQVPCCGGLLSMAQTVAARASRKLPVKAVVVGVEGEILNERWV